MKLRMIAESSARDIPEAFGTGRPCGNRAHADKVSREQTAKSLVYTSLSKLRNMLEPMGLLKAGSLPPEPVSSPEVCRSFDSLRRTVNGIASRHAELILANEEDTDLEAIGDYWGFKIPTSWYHSAGPSGTATADGYLDELIRDACAKAAEESNDETGLKGKALLLKDIGDKLYRWSMGGKTKRGVPSVSPRPSRKASAKRGGELWRELDS